MTSSISPQRATQSGVAIPVTATAFVGFAVTLWLYWPGSMTWDSSRQLAQVVSGNIQNPHPPIMVYLWMVTNRFVYGPGGMLFLHAAAYWTGMAMIASYAARGASTRIVLLLALGFFVPIFGVLGTVWKDVGALSASLLAVGLILHQRTSGSRTSLLASVPVAFYAAAVRVQGIPAVFPLLWLITDGWFRSVDGEGRPSRRSRVLLWVALAGAFAAGTFLIGSVGVQRIPYRAAVPLWDIAMISHLRGEMLVPSYAIRRDGFDLPQLRRVLHPYRCNFADARPGADQVPPMAYQFLSQSEANRLMLHWLKTIAEHPGEYLTHRMRVTRQLLLNPSQRVKYGITAIPDFDPQVRFDRRPGFEILLTFVRAAARSWLYVPLVYGVIATVVLALSFLRTGAPVARWVAASALLSVAPLPVIAPAADFRYSVWLLAGSLVAAVVLPAELASHARQDSRSETHPSPR